MMDITKKTAEILVEAGRYVYREYEGGVWLLSVCDPDWPSQSGYRSCILDPFKHTIDGINQAHIIEDWLLDKHIKLFTVKACMAVSSNNNAHQWRLERIKWCLEQLADAEND